MGASVAKPAGGGANVAQAAARLMVLRNLKQLELQPLPATPGELLEAVARSGFVGRWVDAPDESALAQVATPTIIVNRTTGDATIVLGTRARKLQLAVAGGSMLWVGSEDVLGPDTQALELAFAPRASHLLVRSAGLLWSTRGAYLRSIAYLLLGIVFGVASPRAIQLVIDRALPERAPQLLHSAVAAVLLLGTQRIWLEWLSENALREVNMRGQHASSRHLFRHIMGLEFRELERRAGAELLEAQQRVAEIHSGLQRSATAAAAELFSSVAYFLALAWLAPFLALPLVLVGMLLCGVSVAAGRTKSGLAVEEWNVAATQRGQLIEMLRAQATLQICGAMPERFARWLELLLNGAELTLRRARIQLVTDGASDVLNGAAAVATFLFVGRNALSVGAALSMLMFSDAMIRSFARTGTELGAVLELLPQGRIVTQILQQAPEPLCPVRRRRGSISGGIAVEMDGVWFRHAQDEPWVLEGFDFRAQSGVITELRGRSGAGKTTALRLIAGLYEPERGNVRTLSQRPVLARNDTLYVPQSVQLFQGTLLENLRCLSGGATLESIEAATTKTGLRDWIGSLPMGLHTPLSSGGGNVSGGQRQLIALTAAAASDRSLLLLDECLSQLDPASVARVLSRGAFAGRTVILVHHTGIEASLVG